MTQIAGFDMLGAVVHLLLDGKWLARGRWRAGSLLVIAIAAGASCGVTADDIERWKGTEKGPAQLRATLKNDSLPSELRARCLVAMVAVGMVPDVEEALKDIPEAHKREVIHAAMAPLIAMTRVTGGAETASSARLERQGKDSLFVLRGAASPEDRVQIDGALVEWTTADLEGRMTAGSHSSEKILTAIGAPVGPRLVAVIADGKTSDVNRSAAARLLGKLGDREAKEQGGAKLVEHAKTERKVSDATLSQLAMVGGTHAVAWLLGVATDAKEPPALRARALMSLSQTPDPAELGPALRLAGDATAPAEVRDSAFEVLSKLGPSTLPGLARLLDDKNDKIRWEVVETMLLAGQAQAIPATLEGLPPSRAYAKEDLRDFVVRDIAKLGRLALPPLRDELKSQRWVARLVAAMSLADLGRADDAPRLDALAGDTTKLKGWPANATLGSEARALAITLRQKR